MEEGNVQWEYGEFDGRGFGGKFIATSSNGREIETSLGELGKMGWEGYATLPNSMHDRILMKRKACYPSKDNGYSR